MAADTFPGIGGIFPQDSQGKIDVGSVPDILVLRAPLVPPGEREDTKLTIIIKIFGLSSLVWPLGI